MTPWLDDGDVRLYHGDALETLRQLPNGSVDCCVTSPPYWGLRDYGTDGQVGLEATPDEFVANMVAVFREVRRVLVDHGTCWVNLGDSYNANTGRGFDTNQDGDKNGKKAGAALGQRMAWGKPKDLVGIPWRVAFALQQPWERRVIAREADRAWMAGLVDGEGCVSVCAVQPTTGVNESHSMRVQIRMADTEAVERVVAITGMSKVTYDLDTGDGSRPAQQWKISGDKAADVLADMYPYLTVKRRQAIVGWNLQRLKDGVVTKRGQPIPRENMEKRRALHEVLRKLNQREPVDIPSWCREPFVETEPGWYLRSDVVWAKPNPMPESVTDRPTKAHEYVFLLTKRPRYWFDAEAVREKYGDPAHEWWNEPRTSPGNPDRNDGGGVQSRPARGPDGRKVTTVVGQDGSEQHRNGERWPNPTGRNVRSVWNIATQPYPEAHFATFPEELARRCIVAGCPERVCRVCGKPSERIVERGESDYARLGKQNGVDFGRNDSQPGNMGQTRTSHGTVPSLKAASVETVGWSDCGHNAYRPGVVLDPFMGSGTVAKVARDHQRHAIGIDINEQYLQLAARRLQQLSLLTETGA